MTPPDAPRPPAAEGDALERLENTVRAHVAIHKPFADDVWVDDLRKVTEIARGVRMNTALRGVVPTLGAVAPTVTAAERAALDRLEELHHESSWRDEWEGGDPPECVTCHGPWPCDVALVLAPARRASAAATPDVESTPRVEGGSVVSAPKLQESTPREGGADALFADWRVAVRETEAMVNASVEYDEAVAHIAECRSAERAALAALRTAVATTPRDHAGGEDTP